MTDDSMLDRIREALTGTLFREQKMFGGVCFMVDGNMAVGTSKRGLLVRVGKEGHAAALKRPHTRPMQMGERTAEGYIFVGEAGTATAKALKGWVDTALAYVATLPAKDAKPAAKLRARKAAK